MLLKKLRPYVFTLLELKHFLYIAIPMMISTATDAVLSFVDRLFLSHYSQNLGEAYLNASLIGAFTAFVILSLFMVTAGYSSALVAQYYGAKKPQYCAKVIAQILFFACIAYLIVLLISVFVPAFFGFFKHSALQTQLELSYTRILLWGSLFSIVRSGVGGFFVGIHKTKIVMVANVLGMLVNIPLNYVLIFGVAGIPAMGIEGAALATITSSAIALLIVLCAYYGKRTHAIFTTRQKPILNIPLLKKLLRFGIPSGIETVFSMFVFTFFIAVMSSYGEVVGSAVTIAINWEAMSLIPLFGIGRATTAIVGKHMGAQDTFKAKRTAFLSCTVMLAYATIIAGIMLTFTAPLVEMFLSKMQAADAVRPMASIMVRLACIYLLADAVNISISSVLLGAGDTRGVMIIYMSLHAVFGIIIYIFAVSKILSPLGSWIVFIGFSFSLGIGMLARFLQGHWQDIKMVEHDGTEDFSEPLRI